MYKKPPRIHGRKKKGCSAILAIPPSLADEDKPNSKTHSLRPSQTKEDDRNPFLLTPLKPLLPFEVDNILS
jgi:hypothetical protein